jgi:hypothetical protein
LLFWVTSLSNQRPSSPISAGCSESLGSGSLASTNSSLKLSSVSSGAREKSLATLLVDYSWQRWLGRQWRRRQLGQAEAELLEELGLLLLGPIVELPLRELLLLVVLLLEVLLLLLEGHAAED